MNFSSLPLSVTPAKDLITTLNARLAQQLKTPLAECPPTHPTKDAELKILYAGPQKYFSTRPLSKLKRIEVRSLQLRKRHEGRYLLLRVVSRLCKVVGIGFVGCVDRSAAEVAHLDPDAHALQLRGILQSGPARRRRRRRPLLVALGARLARARARRHRPARFDAHRPRALPQTCTRQRSRTSPFCLPSRAPR